MSGDTGWLRMWWRYLTRCLWRGHLMRVVRVQGGRVRGLDVYYTGERCVWCEAGWSDSGKPI